jgi:thiol:disulfide interchange protein
MLQSREVRLMIKMFNSLTDRKVWFLRYSILKVLQMSTLRRKWFACSLFVFGVLFVGCTDRGRQITKAEFEAMAAQRAAAGGNAKSPSQAQLESNSHHGVTFYTVDHYDESRDPEADLVKTIDRASKENKRVMIQVGGDWCGWCSKMSEFIETETAVRDLMSENYVLMKVTYTNNQPNEAFLSKYPKIKGYPHLFVLDNDGTLLHSQDTAELEEGSGYSSANFAKFLTTWQPKRSSAN